MSNTPLILCRCALARAVPEEKTRAVFEGLSRAGISVRPVADLCGLAARRDPLLQSFAKQDGATVIACQPRAVRWLFHAAGAILADDAAIWNMRDLGADEIVKSLKDSVNGRPRGREDLQQESDREEWIPWFPVIDYDRCNGCLQCKKFCLFNVFAETDEGGLLVKNPANCKTNCPACARICPDRAIIFPKHESETINGSDMVDEEVGEPSRVDLKTLLEGDLYKVLRERGTGAGGLLLAARKKAEEERRQCACGSGDQGEESAPQIRIIRSICGSECEKDGSSPAGGKGGSCRG